MRLGMVCRAASLFSVDFVWTGALALVFEVFDLAQAFLGGGFGFVGAAEIFTFFG
jgi:hypothetical protein